LASFGIGAAAFGNSGTQLPLSQYQAGTESTTLVPNGNFESVSGSDPTGWTEVGNLNTATPTFVNTTNTGSFAAQQSGPTFTDNSTYSQNVAFAPGTAYVMSAYMWNAGNAGPAPHDPSDFDPGDQAVVELVDLANAGHKTTLLLEPIALDGGSGASGYFLYTQILADEYPSGARLDVRFDEDSGGPWPSAVIAQFDNIAITPQSSFVAPSLVPEPAGLSLLVLAALGMRRRR